MSHLQRGFAPRISSKRDLRSVRSTRDQENPRKHRVLTRPDGPETDPNLNARRIELKFMSRLVSKFERTDQAIASWMRAYGVTSLRISLAIVFIWFGLLKPLGASPANELVERTVYWVDPRWFISFLGWWEVAIGVCMLWRPLIRVSIALLAVQMPGTFLPLVLLPQVCFMHVPWAPTLEGQYIIKNLVLISAALVIGGTVSVRRPQTERRQDPPQTRG